MQQPWFLPFIPTGLSYALRSERNWGSPLFFTIETINSCNFKCVYCPQSDPKAHFPNGRGRMSLEDFKRIIANLRSAFDVRAVFLQRDGEPLLHKQLEHFVSHLTEQGISAAFSSNCSLLSRERCAALVDAGLRAVKTDFCTDAALYERLRAGGDWQETRDGIRTLLEVAAERKSPLRVRITDLACHGLGREETERSLAGTRALFADHAERVDVIPVRFHNAMNQAKVNLGGPSGPGEGRRYSLCHHPWIHITIDYAGRVVSCGRDLRSEQVLGNVLEQPARDVWNGEPMRKLRRALLQKRPHDNALCGSCDMPWSGSYSGRTVLEKTYNFVFNPFFKL